ncbi:MAG: hypothetical protein KKH57_07850 [Candidatus Omnitrophica bacterium]|nr:hypothetical protein [Candidatus Omnitrophota bacterium]
MSILVYGILLFIIAILMHLVIWRLCLPKKQVHALLMIFSFAAVLGLFAVLKYPGIIKWNIYPIANIFEIFQLLILYIMLCISYILSYPAIEADSPTLIIINAVFEAGAAGLEQAHLERIADNKLLILPRIRDMVFDRMVYIKDDRYKLLPKGLIMAKLFLFYRNLIKGEKGG